MVINKEMHMITRKNKRSVVSGYLVVIIFLLLIIPILYQIKPVYGTIQVGPGGDYDTIQEAVDNSPVDGTILVGPGIYPEHVVVNKSLSIIGEDPETTIVDGTANGTVFYLEDTASGVNITGFTIRNAGNSYCSIVSERGIGQNDEHQIINNIITTSCYGVLLSYSEGNTIFNNTFIDNPFGGIYLSFAANTNITGNTIVNSENGIESVYSTGVIIVGNTVSETSYALHLTLSSTGSNIQRNILSGQTVGVYSSSHQTTIGHNTITGGAYGIYFYNCINGYIYYNNIENSSYGIRLYNSAPTNSNHDIINNRISNTYRAIELVYARSNTFTGNWIRQNTRGINMGIGCSFNVVYHNNFVQNNMQVEGGMDNIWDDGYPSGGNYWSDYTGVDLYSGPGQDVPGSDGIGDTSYRTSPTGYDNYPLMNTWSEHDILIVNVSTSTNETDLGSIVNINATVKNIGKAGTSETFNVTLKANELPIETKTVTDLAPEENQTLTFNWNTTGSIPGTNYTISVEASPVPDELNTDNNKLVDGMVYIMPVLTGDVNGDGIVDIFDMGKVSAHWYPGPPEGPLGYDADADLNNDGNVDILDMRIVSDHMGETA